MMNRNPHGVMGKFPGAWCFAGKSAAELYHSITETIMDKGLPASPRGQPTRELEGCLTILENPRQRVLSVPGRRINPFFNLAETVWILSGSQDVEWLSFYNKSIRAVANENGTFDGAYGHRLLVVHHDQISDLISELRHDQETRRAYAAIWNPPQDKLSRPSKDKPCNVGFALKLRQGKLNMTVFNRSNDAVLGLTSVNIVQFTTIQEVVAATLGVDVGTYRHYSDSLHIYERNSFGGPSFIDILAETCRRYPFDLYLWVSPARMAKMEWRQLEMIELFNLGDYRCSGPETFQRAMQRWERCPYWSSVAQALYAYKQMRLNAPFGAVAALLTKMAAKDWAIECLRFVVKKYEPRFMELRQAVWDVVGNDGNNVVQQESAVRAVLPYVAETDTLPGQEG